MDGKVFEASTSSPSQSIPGSLAVTGIRDGSACARREREREGERETERESARKRA